MQTRTQYRYPNFRVFCCILGSHYQQSQNEKIIENTVFLTHSYLSEHNICTTPPNNTPKPLISHHITNIQFKPTAQKSLIFLCIKHLQSNFPNTTELYKIDTHIFTYPLQRTIYKQKIGEATTEAMTSPQINQIYQ